MNETEFLELHTAFHKRCKKITGDEWCPYPSEWFMRVIAKVDDKTARKMIEKRRTFLFPSFLAGEPMEKELRVLDFNLS